MTSIYNKYIDSGGAINRVDSSKKGAGRINESRRKRSDKNALLSGILPDWLETGDLVLLILLLFLYIESDDSDFLIVLAVIAFSIYKSAGRL